MKKFFSYVVVSLLFVGILMLPKSTTTSATDIYTDCISKIPSGGSSNLSLRDACSHCDAEPTSRWGTGWLTKKGNNYYDSYIDAGTASTVDVEIHGIYYQCGHSGGSADAMAGSDVYLTSTEGSTVHDIDFVSFSGSYLYRGRTSVQYTWSTGGGSISGTLNTSAFRHWAVEQGHSECANLSNSCSAVVYIHRTPNTGGAEGWSPSTITVVGGTYDDDDGSSSGGDDEGDDPETCVLPDYLTSSASSGWDDGIDGGRSSVASGVTNLSTSNTWKSTIYARPGNTIQYGHCFYSGAQEAYEDEGCSDDCDCGGESRSAHVDNGNSWHIDSVYELDADGDSLSYGDSNEIHGYNSVGHVSGDDVAEYLTQDAYVSSDTDSISMGTETHDCECNECACGNCDGASSSDEEGEDDCEDTMDCDCGLSHTIIAANRYTDWQDSDSATVIVPYNFYLSGSVSINGSSVYAGETAQITATATVNQRYNGHEDIDSTYATRADDVKVRLITFASDTDQSGSNSHTYTGTSGGANGDLCNYFSYISISGKDSYCQVSSSSSDSTKIKSSYTLNSEESTSGGTDTVIDGKTFSVYDIPAGKYFCASVAVYPANSGSYTSTDSDGSGSWAISPSYCVVVAKKPSFQVWGGSIYVNGRISVYSMSKNNLYNNFASWSSSTGYQYSAVNTNPVRYYSSWDELAIILTEGSSVGNMASGAASGYTTNSSGTLGSNPGGSGSAIYTLDNLTIPNSDITIQNKSAVSSSTKTNIINTYIDNTKAKTVSGSINLSDANNYNTEKTNVSETRRTYSTGNLTINASSDLSIRTTHIIAAKGTITINSNLVYSQTSYTSTTQIPQYIIYAQGDININCNVTEINAILIADGTINTCSDSGNVNDAARSTQLAIKGHIIANKLILNRTYGASVGSNSEIPAEIIDSDPTTYLWGISKATKTPKLTTVYVKEMAPRY